MSPKPPIPAGPSHLEIRVSHGKGRGVFATAPIAAGELIELCPVLVLTPAEKPEVGRPTLGHYTFEWGTGPDDEGPCDIHAIVLGYGSLYNHSYSPNADYAHDYDAVALRIVALRDIAPGDEITLNYNGDPEDDSPLWFNAR